MSDLHQNEALLIACAIYDPGIDENLEAELFEDARTIELREALLALTREARADPKEVELVLRQKVVAEASNLLYSALSDCHSAANWRYRHEPLVQRRIVRIEDEARAVLGSCDPAKRAEAVRKLNAISDPAATARIRPVSDFIAEALTSLEDSPEDGVTGLRTGWRRLDGFLGGLQNGRLYVVGAGTAAGKSSLSLQASLEVAQSGAPAVFVSLEMPPVELTVRAIQMLSQVSADAARRRAITAQDIQLIGTSAMKLKGLPLFFVEGRKTLSAIESEVSTAVRQFGAKLAVVDYLQLVKAPTCKEGRVREVGLISSTLKSLGLELGIPILAPAQLNREPTKDNRVPTLADLRESGSIEQDADAVILLHVPQPDSLDDAIEVQALVRKNRSGPCGRVPFIFQKSVTTFREQPPNSAPTGGATSYP